MLQRDRWVVAAALVVVVALAWAWTVAGAGMDMSALTMTAMARMDPADMLMTPAVWTPAYAGLMVSMWWVMMIAMMLPSAAPMILLFAGVHRQQRERGEPYVPAGVFAAGYIVIWGLFSVLATAAQWALQASDLITPMLASASSILAGLLLIAAGAWQFTPLKHRCLLQCRTPVAFITARWRAGARGAFAMGLEHGALCLGCCWALMVLLFVGGVMNLYWIAGLAVFVLLEKALPYGQHLARAAGVLLIVWGSALIAGLL